jgi:hypothetical protein
MGRFTVYAKEAGATKVHEFDQGLWSKANKAPSAVSDGVCLAATLVWLASYRNTNVASFYKRTKTIDAPSFFGRDVEYEQLDKPSDLAALVFEYDQRFGKSNANVDEELVSILRELGSPFAPSTLRGTSNCFMTQKLGVDSAQFSRVLTTSALHVVARGTHAAGVVSDPYLRPPKDNTRAHQPPKPRYKFFDPNWGIAVFDSGENLVRFTKEYFADLIFFPGWGDVRLYSCMTIGR